MLTYLNTPVIFDYPKQLGVAMTDQEVFDRATRIYRGADEIIEHIINDMDLDGEMSFAALAAAYANAAWDLDVSMHDGIHLFMTFYKQLGQKGAAH
jgi:hypothetical protein